MNGRRGVAQPGSAPEWGSGGRRFKSSRPDQKGNKIGGLALSWAARFVCFYDSGRTVIRWRYPFSRWLRVGTEPHEVIGPASVLPP